MVMARPFGHPLGTLMWQVSPGDSNQRKIKKYSTKTREYDKMASDYKLRMDILDCSCILGFPHKYVIQDGEKTLFPLF